MMSNEDNTISGTPTRKRGLRSDIGRIKFNDRDEFALTWIGNQYAIRLDQLQWLLGQMAQIIPIGSRRRQLATS